MTEETFNSLLDMPKVITDPPRKKALIQNSSQQNNMHLKSLDEQYFFEVYWRQHTLFFENFSVGIHWVPRDGSPPAMLMRCNGPHGEHKQFPHHRSSHVHFLDWKRAEEGLTIPKEINLTSDYSTLEEAIIYALQIWNVQEFERHFPFAAYSSPLF